MGAVPAAHESFARHDGLRLHASDLLVIARAIEKLNESGVRVETAVVAGHRLTLEWASDRRDGTYYTVTSMVREGA